MSGPRAWNAFISPPTSSGPVDDAERAAGAERAQVEVVDLRLAGPVEVARELQQLARHVRAERLLQHRR